MALTNAVSFFAASAGTGNFVVASPRASFITPAQAVTLGTMVDGRFYSYLAQNSLTSPTQREWGRAVFTAATNTFQRVPLGGVDNGALHQAGSPINFTSPPIVSFTVVADDLLGGPAGGNTPLVFDAHDLEYFLNGTTGSDNNPGTAALPWKTLQYAADYLAVNNSDPGDIASQITTVNIADGTYAGFAMNNAGLLGYGQQVSWQGNLADPTKVIIQESAAPDGSPFAPLFLPVGGNLLFESLTFKPTAALSNTGNTCIQFNNFDAVIFSNCRFDATAATGLVGIFDLGFSNFCIVTGNTFIDGNWGTLNHQGNYAIFEMEGHLTFGASATFTDVLIGANYGLFKWQPASVSGTATGRQFNLHNCSVETNGIAPSGMPGTTPGIMTPDVSFADVSGAVPVEYNPNQVTTTVGQLGTNPPNVLGLRAVVTDGTAGLAWGATVTGGGGGNSTKYMVWYNGANWAVMGK